MERKKEITITADELSDVMADACIDLMRKMGRDKDDLLFPMMLAAYGALIMHKLFSNEELEVE